MSCALRRGDRQVSLPPSASRYRRAHSDGAPKASGGESDTDYRSPAVIKARQGFADRTLHVEAEENAGGRLAQRPRRASNRIFAGGCGL